MPYLGTANKGMGRMGSASSTWTAWIRVGANGFVATDAMRIVGLTHLNVTINCGGANPAAFQVAVRQGGGGQSGAYKPLTQIIPLVAGVPLSRQFPVTGRFAQVWLYTGAVGGIFDVAIGAGI